LHIPNRYHCRRSSCSTRRWCSHGLRCRRAGRAGSSYSGKPRWEGSREEAGAGRGECSYLSSSVKKNVIRSCIDLTLLLLERDGSRKRICIRVSSDRSWRNLPPGWVGSAERARPPWAKICQLTVQTFSSVRRYYTSKVIAPKRYYSTISLKPSKQNMFIMKTILPLTVQGTATHEARAS
jgi:hypothetical protein